MCRFICKCYSTLLRNLVSADLAFGWLGPLYNQCPVGTPGQSQWEEQRPTYLILKHKLSRCPMRPFVLACIPEPKPTFLAPSRCGHSVSQKVTGDASWATRVYISSEDREKTSNSRLPELAAGTSSSKVNGTLTLTLKDPEIETVLEPETICWKNQLSEVMNDSQKPQPSWERVFEPRAINEEHTHTHTNKWANPTKRQGDTEQEVSAGRGGGQEKGYMGSPLWWQMEAKLWGIYGYILKSNYNPVHRKQFSKKKKDIAW